MADPASYGNPNRDIEQALITLKKGTQLIKYSRKGKPKFRTFRLSPDQTTLISYSHGEERQLKLSSVSRIIPGQRTPVFRRFLRPEKEYLSFSLIYNNGERSLDLICKDKTETEVWLAGLKALTSTGQARIRRTRSDINDLHSGSDISQDNRPFGATLDFTSSISRSRFSIDSSSSRYNNSTSSSSHVASSESANMLVRTSGADGFRLSVSSTPSNSSTGSGPDDIESLGDVYVWGEIWSNGVATDRTGNPIPVKTDVPIPKPLESNVVLDVHRIACSVRHVALVTRQGEVFTWGEESGGRLGQRIEKDFSCPRLVEFLSVTSVDFVACGEFHTCALSGSGDLYTWGDGSHNIGLLGHGNDVSHWIPKRVSGNLEGLQVLQVACGTWHSALATSSGKLFTFGDGTFGALGHGDRESVLYPKEVQSLNGLKTVAVSCGVWHTAAIIEIANHSASSHVSSRKLFTWGDGDKYRLGHGNKEIYLVPTCVSSLIDYNMHQLACGHNITVALTTSGHVFAVGNNTHGELGNPNSEGKSPILVQDRLVGEFVEQIACGAHHVAVLTSRSEVLTWGRGANGRLGHGDFEDRNVPTLVEALKDKLVRNIACGSNFTASICIHKWVSGADQSLCTGCRQAFGFTRKRHNCYNCGQVHCHACSSKKALKAALAPTPGKPHRVCDACYVKLKKAVEIGNASVGRRASSHHRSTDSIGGTKVDRGEVRTSRLLLSPTMEPIRYNEFKSGKSVLNADYSIMRGSQVPSLIHLKDIALPSSRSALQYALKPVITSSSQPHQSFPLPQSNSRPASPYSRRPSPPPAGPAFSRGVIDSLKKTNDTLNQEVSKLLGQVKSLKHKSEAQDTEIERLKEATQEASSLAADRYYKCIRAMQAVKTITDQLIEIAVKLPLEISENESCKLIHSHIESILHIVGAQASEDNYAWPSELTPEQQKISDKIFLAGKSNSIDYHRTEYRNHEENVHRIIRSSVSHKSHSSTESGSGIAEDTEQFEPGVYVTVTLLANGTKTFKRVRFSKRRFSEQQAEAWWKENKDRLMKAYSREVIAAQPAAEEASHETPENNEAAPM